MHSDLLANELERLTVEASRIAIEQRTNLQLDLKSDGTIVTNADKAVENWLLPKLVDLTPGAGYWGEEGSYAEPTEHGFWLTDPIDGTSNFAYGQPLWGITAAFLKGNEIELGIILLPELHTTLIAKRGQGVTLNGKPLPPIPPGAIARHQLIGHGSTKLIEPFHDLGKARHLGAFVLECLYVATQQMRAMTTGRCKLYDAAAGILAVRELGGEVRHVDGTPFQESEWVRGEKFRPVYIGPKDSNFPFGREF